MRTEDAIVECEAAIAKGARPMVFDWCRAARIIRDSPPVLARAGLRGDWEWTGGDIWRNGLAIPARHTYTYLASRWAMPELELDGIRVQCWCWMDGTGWDANTYWPREAYVILRQPKEASA